MVEYLKRYLYKKYGVTKGVNRALHTMDFIQGFVILFIIGYMFNSFEYVIIGSIILMILDEYGSHFHCKNLNNCVILTSVLFSVFSIIYKEVPMWASFLIVLLYIKDMYFKCPLKVKRNKTEEWHKKNFMMWNMIFLSIAIALYYFNLYNLSSAVLCSLIMYGLLFFINKDNHI